MAGDRFRLEVKERTGLGTPESRRLRKQGFIPGVLYGRTTAKAFAVGERDLRAALTGPSGLHAVLDVVLEGQSTAHPSILKEYQRDPIRGHVRHIDLQEVRLDVAIQATVNVHLHGAEDAPGIKEGGVLNQPATTLNVEALPMEVPESIEADVSGLEMGGALRLEDLPKLEGVTFLDDPHETVIATVSAPTVEAEPEPEEGEELAEGEEAPEGAPRARPPRARPRPSPTPPTPRSNAPLPSGRERLDAGPARRRSRQPGPRARARPAQRRLDGRRRAGAAPRRLLPLQVLRPARRGPRRRAEARAAEARDLHEPLRQLARRGRALLQAPDRADRGRPRRRRPRPRPHPGPARRRPRRAQRAPLDPAGARLGRVPPRSRRRRPPRPRRPSPGRGLRAEPVRARGRRRGLDLALGRRGRDAAREGLDEAQRRFN